MTINKCRYNQVLDDKYCAEKESMIRIQSNCNAILDKVVISGPSKVVGKVTFEQKLELLEGRSHANVWERVFRREKCSRLMEKQMQML